MDSTEVLLAAVGAAKWLAESDANISLLSTTLCNGEADPSGVPTTTLPVTIVYNLTDGDLEMMMTRKSLAVTSLIGGMADFLGVPQSDVKITQTDPDLLGGRRLAGKPKPGEGWALLTVDFEVTGVSLKYLSALLGPLDNGVNTTVSAFLELTQAAFLRTGIEFEKGSMYGVLEVTVFYPTPAPTPAPTGAPTEESSGGYGYGYGYGYARRLVSV